MEYVKTNWVDHIVNSETGEVLQQGTAITAVRMNNIENGLYTLAVELEDTMEQVNGEVSQQLSDMKSSVQALVRDVSAIAFELIVNNTMTVSGMKHVFIDTIESISDVVLTKGQYGSGKVYI